MPVQCMEFASLLHDKFGDKKVVQEEVSSNFGKNLISTIEQENARRKHSFG